MSEAPARLLIAHTLHYDGTGAQALPLEVPVETPVNLVYGGLPHVVLMATPENLDDLALGFTITEGLVTGPEEIRGIAVRTAENGIVVDIALAPEAMQRFLSRRRNMAGRTSCGLCGVESLDQIAVCEKRVDPSEIAAPAIASALRALGAWQPLHSRTRAVHAAGWFTREGHPLLVREDVGRHNALDKMIGACLSEGYAAGKGFVVITSRCSYEMVEKAALFGASTLVAISAPTSLAVERAEALGVRLIAIARGDSAMVFPTAGLPQSTANPT